MMPRMRRRKGQRHAAAAGGVLAAMLLAGCGPTAPLDLSVLEYPTSVQYGQPSSAATPAPAPQPAPPAVLVAPPVIAPVPPPVELHTALPTSEVPCPTAGPLAPAAVAASDTPASPPVAATYSWREAGSITLNGSTVQFPASDSMTVANVTNPDSQGVFSYDVTTTGGGLDGRETVTTTYEVVPAPGGGTVGGVNTNQASAIYITKVVTAEPTTGQQLTFTPSPPIEYLAVPAAQTDPAWMIDSTDTSPTGDVTVEKGMAQITGHGRVDACGTVLDAWQVTLSVDITSATQSLHLDETYDVGTEYGGVPLQVTSSYRGTDQSATVSSSGTETIDEQPQVPS